MYCVMIVDDETVICEAIKSKLRRLHHIEIGDIHIANSAEEALERIPVVKPDILLTDIKMQEQTGIDLIRQLVAMGFVMKYIVISGYDDYQYVREGFKFGICDYLLKPISIEDLEKCLKTAIHDLESKRKEESSNQSDKLKKAKYLLQAKLNQNVLLSKDKINDELIQTVREYLEQQWFCMGIISILDHSIVLKVEETIMADIDSMGLKGLCFTDYQDRTVIIFNTDTEDIKVEMILCDINERFGDYGIAIALSNFTKDITMIGDLYSQADDAMSYKFISQEAVIKYDKLVKNENTVSIPEQELQDLFERRGLQSVGKVHDFISKWFSDTYVRRFEPKEVKKLYDAVKSSADALAKDLGIVLTENIDKGFQDFFNIETLRNHLKSYINVLREKLNERSNREVMAVKIAKKYIEENYSRDIGMTEIANMLSMNYSYFSKRFKEQTGLNFSEYLIKVRIEKAKELLTNPSYRINEISEKVGYINSQHFSRAFKKYMGISPIEFRNEI